MKDDVQVMEEKYVVFKSAEFDAFLEQETTADGMLPHALDDFVVLRLQDRFTPPALFAYANQIQTLLEFIEKFPQFQVQDNEQDQEDVDTIIARLKNIRDHFQTLAHASDEMARKLPD